MYELENATALHQERQKRNAEGGATHDNNRQPNKRIKTGDGGAIEDDAEESDLTDLSDEEEEEEAEMTENDGNAAEEGSLPAEDEVSAFSCRPP